MPRREPLYTADDLAEAERDLAWLLEQHEAEEDPAQRDMLADWIAMDSQFLAEMREVVAPALPFILPLGVPAPRPVWRGAR
jgi:hypothetical protein